MWPVIRRALVRVVEARGAAAFMTASLVVGALVGLGASMLVWGIAVVERLVSGLEGALGTWRFLVAVPAGFTAAWVLDRRFGPGVMGGGVTETMVGMSLRGGYLPTRTIGPKIAATALTLGAGGSAGREGPIVQIGATIGSSLATYTRFGEDQIRGLVAAGAGAGIAAAFNAPIAWLRHDTAYRGRTTGAGPEGGAAHGATMWRWSRAHRRQQVTHSTGDAALTTRPPSFGMSGGCAQRVRQVCR